MRIRRAIAALAAVSLLSIAPVPARAAACPSWPSPVAHRGGTERFAEDTRHAFRDATRIGVNFWENDVRFTADDVPIIMHDPTVDRTTNGTGAVADLTWAYISTLHTADGQPVPTLAEFINDQSFASAYAFVELKTAPTEVQWGVFVATVKSREGWGGPRPAISSFDPAVLDRVATVEDGKLAGYTRALIQSTGDADPADITPHASILLKHHDAITYSRLAGWTAAGLRVFAWADPAADPPSEWERMAGYRTAAGRPMVSGYITSSPSAYLAASKMC